MVLASSSPDSLSTGVVLGPAARGGINLVGKGANWSIGNGEAQLLQLIPKT